MDLKPSISIGNGIAHRERTIWNCNWKESLWGNRIAQLLHVEQSSAIKSLRALVMWDWLPQSPCVDRTHELIQQQASATVLITASLLYIDYSEIAFCGLEPTRAGAQTFSTECCRFDHHVRKCMARIRSLTKYILRYSIRPYRRTTGLLCTRSRAMGW